MTKGDIILNINTLGKQEIKVSINQHKLDKKIVDGKNKQINFSFDPIILNKDKRILAIALKSFIFR